MAYKSKPYRIVLSIALFEYLIQLLLGILNPYKYYPLASSVISSVFAACSAIALGLLPIRMPLVSFGSHCMALDSIYSFKRYRLWLLLQAVQILVCIVIGVQMLVVLYSFGFDFSAARSFYFFSTTFAVRQLPIFIFFIFLQQSVSALVSPVVAISLIRRVRIPRLTLLSFAANLFLAITTGSRTFLYELFLSILLAFVVIDTSERPSIPRLFGRVKSLLLPLLSMIPVLISRTSDGLLGFMYVYLVGPLFFFSQLINPNNIKIEELVDAKRLGFSFVSLDWLVVGIYNFVSGQPKIPSLVNLLDYPINSGAMIGDSQGLNAFPSGFYYFFVDAGELGVFSCIGLLALALSLCNVGSFKGKILFIVLGAGILDMVRTNLFASPTFLLTSALICLL